MLNTQISVGPLLINGLEPKKFDQSHGVSWWGFTDLAQPIGTVRSKSDFGSLETMIPNDFTVPS